MTRTPTKWKSQKDVVASTPPPVKGYSGESGSSYIPVVNLYYLNTRANVQLIWSEKRGTNNDGFMNELRKAIEDKDNPHPIRSMGVILVGKRRQSKADNSEVLNNTPTQFPRLYFVRANTDELGDQTFLTLLPERMKLVLEAMAKFLNEAEADKVADRVRDYTGTSPVPPRVSKPWSNYVVPVVFDRTPMIRLPLDHYIQDESIVQLVKMCGVVEGEDWSTWGQDDIETAKDFFSEPFPAIAVEQLGYPDA